MSELVNFAALRGNIGLGVFTGFVLFFVFEGGVIWFNFRPWLKQPTLTPGPSPERFLRAAVQSFIAMLLAGAILTKLFSTVDFEDNALIDWFGYNSICLVFDTPPSTYISPVFWFFVAYAIVRYSVEDTRRLMQLKNIGAATRVISYGVNIALVIVAAVFSLVLAVGPEQDMIAHTAPFMALILVFPLVYIMHCWQCADRSSLYVVAVSLFALSSLAVVSFTSYALVHVHEHAHVSPSIAQPAAIIWVLFAIAAPFLMPAPKVPDAVTEAGS